MKNLLNNSASNQHRNILLVEDDESLTEILAEVFHQEGYHFKSVLATENILPMLAEYMPDLVLLDYILPRVNGGELCSQIKQHPSYCTIPVIIYSAYSKVLMSLGDYGCDAFMEKPFNLDELIRKINKLTKHSSKVA